MKFFRAVFTLILLGTMASFLYSCSQKKEPYFHLRPVTFNEWQQELKRFEPKIVVVDAWATWCETCLERFPHMVKMSEKFQNRGVQFVSLNLDDVNSKEEQRLATEFVRRMEARFPHYLMNENMMDAFEKLNFLSLPVVLIYDKSGNEKYRLSSDNPNQQFTNEDVENAIASLLAESAGA